MLVDVEGNFPGTRVTSVNGKPVNPNIRVCDLVDDLEAVYKVDNSKAAQAFRKQQRQNELFIEKFIKQKGLKK